LAAGRQHGLRRCTGALPANTNAQPECRAVCAPFFLPGCVELRWSLAHEWALPRGHKGSGFSARSGAAGRASVRSNRKALLGRAQRSSHMQYSGRAASRRRACLTDGPAPREPRRPATLAAGRAQRVHQPGVLCAQVCPRARLSKSGGMHPVGVRGGGSFSCIKGLVQLQREYRATRGHAKGGWSAGRVGRAVLPARATRRLANYLRSAVLSWRGDCGWEVQKKSALVQQAHATLQSKKHTQAQLTSDKSI
jgi:hypothetical protein